MRACGCSRRQIRERRGLVALLGAGAVLLLVAGFYLWLLGGTRPPRAAAIGGPFELTAADGRVVTDRSFRGRYLLVYFGYTSCRDVCPTTLSAMATAMGALGPRAARIQPLFITLDPGRDTPAVLRGYVAAFAPLIGLTGTTLQLRQVQQEYRVSSIFHGTTIDHSSVLYLVDPEGRFLVPIRADESGAEMANDIGRYLS